MQRKIDLPQMRRAAEVLPASFDEEARTIDAVWSTGAVVRRVPFFDDPYDEEISLTRHMCGWINSMLALRCSRSTRWTASRV